MNVEIICMQILCLGMLILAAYFGGKLSDRLNLGDDIAILHGRLSYLEEPAVALGILPKDHKVLFGEGKGESIETIYMVLSPERDPGIHLQVLAAIAKLLSGPDVRTRLRYAKDKMEALSIIKEHSDGGSS